MTRKALSAMAVVALAYGLSFAAIADEQSGSLPGDEMSASQGMQTHEPASAMPDAAASEGHDHAGISTEEGSDSTDASQ